MFCITMELGSSSVDCVAWNLKTEVLSVECGSRSLEGGRSSLGYVEQELNIEQ